MLALRNAQKTSKFSRKIWPIHTRNSILVTMNENVNIVGWEKKAKLLHNIDSKIEIFQSKKKFLRLGVWIKIRRFSSHFMSFFLFNSTFSPRSVLLEKGNPRHLKLGHSQWLNTQKNTEKKSKDTGNLCRKHAKNQHFIEEFFFGGGGGGKALKIKLLNKLINKLTSRRCNKFGIEMHRSIAQRGTTNCG